MAPISHTKQKIFRRGEYYLNETPDGVIKAIMAFQEFPELHRKVLGNNPKYFPFIQLEGQYLFGLSKFCAFKDINTTTYLSGARHATSGGNTQEHLARILEQKWRPESAFNPSIQAAFRGWIDNIYGTPQHHNYFLMEVTGVSASNNHPKGRKVSPEELFKRLEARRLLGIKGEALAMIYESNRIQALGCPSPEKYLHHESQHNTAAGFDILSSFKELRHIEVKATTAEDPEIYVTANEYKILSALQEEAYLYIVHFNKAGTEPTVYEIQNPIPWLQNNAELSTQLYKASINTTLLRHSANN